MIRRALLAALALAGSLGLAAAQQVNFIGGGGGGGSGTVTTCDGGLTQPGATECTLGSPTNHGILLGQGASAIVATAAMTDGQLLIGQSAADPLPKTLSQDCTLAATGVITCTKTNNVAFGTAATQNTGTSGATIPLLNGTNTWSAQQTVNLNAAAAPTPATGTGVQLVGADATVARFEADSFGAIAAFTARRANGTDASPTALLSGDQIGAFNFHGFYVTGGPAYSSVQANLAGYAAQNWTSTNQGTKVVIRTTPNNSTTLTDALTVGQDGSAIVAGSLTVGAGAALTSTGAGGALGTNAFSSTSYMPLAGGTFTGGIGFSTTNTLDIGTSATVLAPRTVYAGTSFVGPVGTFTTSVTTPLVNLTGTALVFQSGGVTGTINWAPATSNKAITLPNGTTDFTATGGTSQVLKQVTAGAAITVAQLACADLSNAGTGCSATIGSYLPLAGGTMTGGIGFSTTNTLDIGTDASTLAPRNVYAGTAHIGPTGTFTSTINAGAGPAILTSPAAASLQLGAADVDTNAAMVAQVLRTQGALAGGTSNQAGKDYTVIVSPGKGTGAGGNFVVQTAPAGSTGTVVGTPTTAMTVNVASTTVPNRLIVTGDGSNTSPSIGMSGTKGFFSVNSGFGYTNNSSNVLYTFGSGTSAMVSGIALGWSSSATDSSATIDLQIRRATTATLQMGAATGAGAAVAQTFTVQGSSGASAAAALFTIAGSDQSGTGTTGGAVTLRAGNTSGASGTRTGGGLTLAGGTGATVGGTIILQTAATTSLTTALTIGTDQSLTAPGPISFSNATVNLTALANVATTSAVCYNTGSGLLTYNGTVGTCTVSDGRLKTVDGPLTGSLAKLLQIKGVYYHWKDPAADRSRQIGVIAQDVEKVFPELVSTDSKGTKSADYLRLTAPIIEAIRELNAGNDNLRAKLVALEARSR